MAELEGCLEKNGEVEKAEEEIAEEEVLESEEEEEWPSINMIPQLSLPNHKLDLRGLQRIQELLSKTSRILPRWESCVFRMNDDK